MSWIELHARFGSTALYYTLIMAVWGMWRFFRKQGVDGSYWGALLIAEVIYLLQATLGVIILVTGAGSLAGQGMHLLYGIVSVLVIPAAFAYTRGDAERRATLVYGAAFLFLVGILLRSLATA